MPESVSSPIGNIGRVNSFAGQSAEAATATSNGAASTETPGRGNGSNGTPPLRSGSAANTAQAAREQEKEVAAIRQQAVQMFPDINGLRQAVADLETKNSQSAQKSGTKISQQQATIDNLRKQLAQLKESPTATSADSPGNKKIIAQEIQNICRGFGSAAAGMMMVVGGVSMIGLAILGGPAGLVLCAGLMGGVGYLAVKYFLSQEKKEAAAALKQLDRSEPAEPSNTAAKINTAHSPKDEAIEEDDDDEDEDEDQPDEIATPLASVAAPVNSQGAQARTEPPLPGNSASQADNQSAGHSATPPTTPGTHTATPAAAPANSPAAAAPQPQPAPVS